MTALTPGVRVPVRPRVLRRRGAAMTRPLGARLPVVMPTAQPQLKRAAHVLYIHDDMGTLCGT